MSDSPRTGFEGIQRFQPTMLDEIERKAREQVMREYACPECGGELVNPAFFPGPADYRRLAALAGLGIHKTRR